MHTIQKALLYLLFNQEACLLSLLLNSCFSLRPGFIFVVLMNNQTETASLCYLVKNHAASWAPWLSSFPTHTFTEVSWTCVDITFCCNVHSSPSRDFFNQWKYFLLHAGRNPVPPPSHGLCGALTPLSTAHRLFSLGIKSVGLKASPLS